MANLRMVYDNAADTATITASSTAGSLAATNLQTDMKSEVWRSNNVLTGVDITMTWAAAKRINMVALPFNNFTAAATMRVRGYTLSGDSVAAYDATFNACTGALTVGGVNTFAYGGGTYASAWLPSVGTWQKLIVTLADSTNPSGYLEAGRIVCGEYWSPTYTAEAGAELGVNDTTKNERSDAGDLRSDRGIIYKILKFDLNFLTTSDRDKLFTLLRANGAYKPVYISLVPESTDAQDEQIFQIYGKLVKAGSLKYQLMNQFVTQLEIEEV